ncbi:MAG: TetR/AcrR family transcriptional regulator [Planctomycetes bacterium]|nr:TetR/AcrR family transcriptional regulator [Planctomycetota bacterium]
MPREKNFDVDVALAEAGKTFWSQGYEATSMLDLLAAMGIQKASFYDTYGSKKEAYLRSLQQYADSRFTFFSQLIDGMAPKESICALINQIYEECISADGHNGCMVINCALELAHSDLDAQRVVQRALEAHENSFAELVSAGQQVGEISSELNAAATGKAMLAMLMGMRVFARAGATPGALRSLADQVLRLI